MPTALSIIDLCRKDPVKFNILYYNLSAAAITKETQLAEFGMIDQLSTNEQLCYQYEMPIMMTLLTRRF